MNPPSGVVTFLFTDIEGSTRRWESDADAMRSALAVHDKVLRSAIEAQDGYVFSHSGDGMAAAFASPMAAVEAAVHAQRELQLPVRMGIATGEAELRDDDYFGPVLNRAARVMAAGHGGQILVAESTAGLLSGVQLIDLGHRRLRDLPNPVTVFQLEAEGLSSDFPPLRTIDTTPGNLRRADSVFVGRDAEVVDIAALVRSRRLVTLTGVGGVGKTRLAVEVAARLSHEYPDGVWFFEFGAVSDPGEVPESVAAVLGITQQPDRTLTRAIATALDGRVRLLVFDNCEHVLDSVGDLADAILAESATVTIVATSREGLALPDEQVWPVRSLSPAAAAELFTERARHLSPSLDFADANVVADICRRLDCIPLAIELAASRTASMAVDEIRDHLDQRFKLLVGSRRALGRHQTLRHAVAWSYDLLDDAEKVLLERCSVFAGGFDLKGACAVAGSDADHYRVVDLLDVLVRKSLVVADHSSGRTRFSILETIREFADEQLADRGDAADARNAHARHFARLESDILEMWNGPRQSDAYRWFTTELPNLRAAFRWAVDGGQLDIAASIATYTFVPALALENQEPSAWAEELLEAAEVHDHPRLGFLYLAAALCWMSGRLNEAFVYNEKAQACVRSGRSQVPFGLEGLLGGLHMVIGQVDKALEWEDAYRDVRSDPLALSRSNHLIQLVMAGRIDDAMAAAPEVVAAAESTGNPYALSCALLGYGFAFRDVDAQNALDGMRRGLGIAHDSGNPGVEAYLANNIGRLEARRGDFAAALDYLTLALRINQNSGSTTAIRSPLAILAETLHKFECHESAAVITGFAVSPLTVAAFPEVPNLVERLREVLGDDRYESLASVGESMTTAAIATYAFDQIEQARIKLQELR
ncbi:adenylate/guanylate cyclase domain-containing protein [Mycolicibacterium tusciae]|uniref:Adenylate/guanylate cyclase domain-containing protein n=1 Tax=Mycolicibacterium tusciae TaxID=75922 RepID=A0A1X0K0E9_9MYCO|nr:adenylate/guanylate cyclase domain-containing protein [Mycolicibacterium tusciae]ORB68633.1 adenylate/guanylate cyclase domain-containing protein [Mycolicibacterium tusciae]